VPLEVIAQTIETTLAHSDQLKQTVIRNERFANYARQQ